MMLQITNTTTNMITMNTIQMPEVLQCTDSVSKYRLTAIICLCL